MKNKLLIFSLFLLMFYRQNCRAQAYNNPLKMAWSTDGINFDPPTIFQDSSGVPSVIKWKGDTLVAVFQWFRVPKPSPTWDRVAVKFSYDNGLNWTNPIPIVINDLPPNYQRPFDPTLVVLNMDSLRIYFSSSIGTPPLGIDSTVNTYSASSVDGVHYEFEPGPRVDEPSNKVIDPAVIFFKNIWHFAAPIGAPQQGAYHYVSSDGLNFNPVPPIPSDNNHNWTGNYLVDNSNELRFYGSGQNIWYNSSPNGGVWNGYVATNIKGGDPSVVKLGPGSYLMIYVGQPYTTGIEQVGFEKDCFVISPVPATDKVTIMSTQDLMGVPYILYDVVGRAVVTGLFNQRRTTILDLGALPSGTYFFRLKGNEGRTLKILRQ